MLGREERIMRDMKPCPFCGGEASIHESNRYPSLGGRITGYTVVCTNTHCINYMIDDWYKRSKKKAIKRWNTRAERTCVPILVPRKNKRVDEICSCGHLLRKVRHSKKTKTKRPKYCSECGAKIIAKQDTDD